MIDKNQICDLLGSGLANAVVARAVGCEESYISQLMSDSEFADSVAQKRSEALTAHTKRDLSIDSVEDLLLVQLKEAVETKQIYKPNEILRAWQVMNAGKRRGVPMNDHATVQNQVVTINLPTQIIQEFTMNPMGEVIEAGDKTLVTMPAHSLLNRLASEKGTEGGERYKQLGKYLPQGITSGVGSVASIKPEDL